MGDVIKLKSQQRIEFSSFSAAATTHPGGLAVGAPSVWTAVCQEFINIDFVVSTALPGNT